MGNPQAKNPGCAMVDRLFRYKFAGQVCRILSVVLLAAILAGCGNVSPGSGRVTARGEAVHLAPGADTPPVPADQDRVVKARIPWIISTSVFSTAFLSLLVFSLRGRRETQRLSLIARNSAAELERERALGRAATENAELMLNAVPLVCSLWDKNYICIDCNREALRFFGLKKKWEFREGFFDYSPEFQSDGRRSREQLVSNIEKAFAEGAYTFTWTHQNPDSTLFSVEVALIRVKRGDDFLVAASAIDLREYTRVKKGEEARVVQAAVPAAAEPEIPPVDLRERSTADSENKKREIENIAGFGNPIFRGDVLVCEDNKLNQQLIVGHLAKAGLNPEIAENGKEGLNKVQSRAEKGEKPFDLILMDIYMPVMGGIEAAPEIMRLGTGTPVVAMTTNITAEERELYQTAGMDDYIGKPFMPWELRRCLSKYLKPVGFADVKESGRDKHGDEEFRRQLRADFAKSNKTKFEEINAAVDSGDITLAHRLAHTLKGSAGLIGKPALQKAAADVEASLKNRENPVSQTLMDALKTELKTVLGELNPLLTETGGGSGQAIPAGAPSGTDTGFNAQKARELFVKLEPLLKSGNPECLNYSDELRLIPGSRELIERMEDFYFGEAEIILAELKKKMEGEEWTLL